MEPTRWVSYNRVFCEEQWTSYIQYLRNWAEEHADSAYAGASPACYDEWLDNEYAEEEEEE